METQDTSTGNFDQAFSESVIDSFDFDFPPPSGGHVNWFCIDGEAMKSSIKGKIDLRKRVTSISINCSMRVDANILVQCSDNIPRDPYLSVFNTTSLGCLQRMDLSNLELHPSQKDAIRCLHYDDSCNEILLPLVDYRLRYQKWGHRIYGYPSPYLRMSILQHPRPPPMTPLSSSAAILGHKMPNASPL